MYAHIGARKLFLLLLMTTVVNADWIKEATLTYNINVRCAVLFASFGNVSCQQDFIIHVINAHYGYSNRDVSESCSIQPNDCLLSVSLHSISYYNDILVGCNNKTRCDSNLVAEKLDSGASCDGYTENDYVLIQFYCLPSEVKTETVSVCIKDYSQGATCITCAGNRVIQIVGATLGFQPDTDDWCSVGFDKCRIQPDLNHLEDIRFSCQGQNICQFNATTSIDRVNHTCDSLEYTFETVIYYCLENSGALVTGIGECTSAAPSTVPVTSVAVSTTSNSTNTSTEPSTVPVTSVVVSTTSKSTTTSTTPITVPVTSVAVSTTSKSTTTSTTPSTVPVTSATRSSSLSASSTTGGATIASDASTYTMIDNLGNVSSIASEPTSSTDDTTSIIVGCVVGGVVLIILLLLLIFIVWRRRNSEDTSKRRGNGSVNGCLSDNTDMPTHSLGNIGLYELAPDQLHPPVYWLTQEQSSAANVLTQEQLADYYSDVEDLHLAQEPYSSLFSIEGFDKEIDKSNAGVYVNVTQPSNAVYSLVQKTNSSTHQKGEDPVDNGFLPVGKSEFANKVRIDKDEEKVSALMRHQSVQRPDQDLVLRENSLYGATETHTLNDAVDKSELAKVRIDNEEKKMSALMRHQSVKRSPEDDLVLRENSLYGATETHTLNDAVDKSELAKVKIDKEEENVSALTRHRSVQRPEDDLVLRENSLYVATETHTPNDAVDELTLTENDLYG